VVSTLALLVAAAVIGAALVTLALLRPTMVLVFVVFMDATGINVAIDDDTGFSPFKPLLGLVVLALFVLWRQKKLRFGWSPVLTAILILYACWLFSVAISVNPSASKTLFTDYGTGFVYFALIYVLVLSTGSWRQMLYAMVGGLAALATLTIFHQVVLHNVGNLHGLSNVPLVQEDGALTPRHSGTAYDVNFWGRTMVFMIPMALTLFAIHKKFWKLFWLGCAFALAGGLFLTQSRGGFLAVVPAVLVWFLLAGKKFRRSIAYFPIVAAVAVPLSGVGSRLATLLSFTHNSNYQAQDPSLVTRVRFQKAAWHMFLDKPVFGHGMGTYGTLFPEYDRYSDLGDPVNIVVAAHNFYLEQAADGGIMLLTAWFIFFGTMFFCAWRIYHNASLLGLEREKKLAVAVAAGLTGWMSASIFLHLSDLRVMLAIAAITASVDVRMRWKLKDQANVPAAPEPSVAVGVEHRPWVPRVAVLTAIVLGLGGLAMVVHGAPKTWQAEQELRVGVTPTSTVDGMTSYQTDLITRGQLVPSFTAIADSRDATARAARQAGLTSKQVDGAKVTFSVSRQGGGVLLTATASDRSVASRLAVAAGRLASQDVTYLHTPYYLQQAPPPAPTATHPLLLYGLGALAAAVLALVVALLFRRRPPQDFVPLDDAPSVERDRELAPV
jgi:O-antigen ligase